MEFPARLKQLRTERGISQENLGAELNLGKSTISSYEAEGRQPNYDTLIKLANYFDVSVDYLLGVTPIRNKYTELKDDAVREWLDFIYSRTKEENALIHEALERSLKLLEMGKEP